MRRQSVPLPDSNSRKSGVSELNNRLQEIFSHHRTKGARAEQLEKEKAELQKKFESQREDKERTHQQRIAVFQKQVKALELRLDASNRQIKNLEKEVIHNEGQFGAEKQRSLELLQNVEALRQSLASSKSTLRNEQARSSKINRELSEALKALEASRGRTKAMEEAKAKLEAQLAESHHLQKKLTELMNKRDAEVRELETQLKKMRDQATSLEDKLKVEMTGELAKHLRIRDGQHVQEISRLAESMKEEHKKNLADYKEAVMAKNHDIENLKESNTRMKSVVEALKLDKERLVKERNENAARVRNLEVQLRSTSSESSIQVQKQDKLLHELRSKYIQKTSEMETLQEKYKDLETEINAYRSLIEQEEKVFIGTKRKRTKEEYEPPKKRRKLEGTVQQFDLASFDLNKNCLILKCVDPAGASLEGWHLINGDKSKHFQLPHTQFFPNEKRRILIGRGVRPDQPSDILWREDVWDGYGTDMIQLVNPDGIVVSLINLHTDFLPAQRRTSTCVLM